MPKDDKFAAIVTSFEAAERAALLDVRRIEEVREERLRALQELRRRQSELRRRGQKLVGSETRRQLLAGDLAQLNTVRRFGVKLVREAEALEDEIREREAEYRRAVERVKLAEDELRNARIERRKVEQLSARRRQLAYVRDVAAEEEKLDEMNTYRSSK